MGKRKKGRPRGRGGGVGANQRGGNHYRQHARPYQSVRHQRRQPQRRAGRQRRAGPRRAGQRRARNAPQRLRLPPRSRQQLRPRDDRSLRARQHDREVRPARGRVASTAWCRPDAASKGPRLREITDVDGMPPDDYKNVKTLRRTDAHQPRVLAAAGGRPRAADHPGDGPADAAGQGPAGADRRPAAHRQDDPPAAHQPGHLHQLSPTSS